MAVFRQIAPLIIREYGPHRMFILYMAGGVFGFLISFLAGVHVTIGASAAVCGLIGAAIYYGKSRGGVYGQAIYKQIGGWAVAILILGLIIPGINNWGHAGGFLAGIGCGALLGYIERKPEASWHRTLALVFALLTIAVLGWAVATSLHYRILN
jgi:rhomboid protease GluP